MMSQTTFKKLVQEHRNRVFSYTLYFLRNREDAEDVTQEVLIRLWKNMNKIDRKKIVPWLMQVAHNCCIDHVRKRKSVGKNGKIIDSIEVDNLPSEVDAVSHPDQFVEYTETQELLLSALNTLPERTKSMMLLHYFQGLKYTTISNILNTDVGTVKVAVHRGRRMLREKLTHHFAETLENCCDE